ncbi:MAG TPA: hypothetical protein ENH21_06915 [Chromatiales bacterium]|nr:hypothetical protein [Chromatiales bacterium]HEX23145.1 hypothetical protein [Chromatiales bacterium]
MRDYSNMPTLHWEGPISAKKAIAQVHHAEPVILQMPEDFVLAIDAPACGCEAGDAATHHIDCHAENTLKTLAEENNEPALAELAEIAHEAGQVVDIQTDTRRIIIHD